VAWDILVRGCLLARDVGFSVYADVLCLNTRGCKHESESESESARGVCLNTKKTR